MVAAARLPVPPSDPEHRVLLHGVSWADYERFLALLDDQPSVRLSYLDGELEIMTTSLTHEQQKKLLGRLVEAYCDAVGVDAEGYGGATFRKAAKRRGFEGDETYVFGSRKTRVSRPDLVIEIVVASPLLDKLDIFAGLAIPEVWIFEQGRLRMLRLAAGQYLDLDESVVLPGLGRKVVETCARESTQSAAVRRLRALLRAK